jgi:uncharacterized membrane protein
VGKLLVLVPIILYGLWNLFIKLAALKLHPIQIAIIGSSTAIITFPIYAWLLANKIHAPFSWVGFWWAIAAYACSILAALTFIYLSRDGEAGTLAALMAASPIITFTLSAIFLREQFTVGKTIGILLVVIGAVILGH